MSGSLSPVIMDGTTVHQKGAVASWWTVVSHFTPAGAYTEGWICRLFAGIAARFR